MGNSDGLQSLIIDPFLIRVLEEIDTVHGEILIGELPQERIDNGVLAAMEYRWKTDEFVFLLPPAQEGHPPPLIVCHELLHASLLLNGWPLFRSRVDYSGDNELEDAIGTLIDLAQHVVIWPAMEILGYNEEDNWTYDVAFLISIVASGAFFQKYPRDDDLPIRAISLAEALLSPAKAEVKTRLRAIASEFLPQDAQLAATIESLFERARPFSPKSCLNAFYQSFETAGGSREILPASSLPKIHKGFLQWVLDLRQRLKK